MHLENQPQRSLEAVGNDGKPSLATTGHYLRIANKINPEDEAPLIAHMEMHGWKCDVNDRDTLGFIMPVNEETEWIRDYNKHTGRFVQFNGKQKVNLRCK